MASLLMSQNFLSMMIVLYCLPVMLIRLNNWGKKKNLICVTNSDAYEELSGGGNGGN